MGTALRTLRAAFRDAPKNPIRVGAGWFGFAPALTLALFLLPIAAGLLGTVLPAFGYLPAIGGHELSMQPWRDLFAQPGVWTSLRLTLSAGVLAAILSLLLALGFCALGAHSRGFRRLQLLVPPLLATPHVAMAVGFAFVAAPSGWIVRALSPWLTGWERPPTDLVTVQDPLGLAMVAGLLLKEVPYLILMTLAALNQVPQRALLSAGASLGYPRLLAWIKLVLPQIYPQLRLPVYAVLAFSLSNVEVALILAPGNPPPLAVLALRWFSGYDLQLYFPAAAASCLQLVMVALAILCWRGGEELVARLGRRWCAIGNRRDPANAVAAACGLASLVVFGLGVATLAAMGIWSLADSWRYPQAWPAELSLRTWIAQGPRVADTVVTTLTLALGSALAALLLAIACLENESRRHFTPAARVLWLVYLPLLVPQIAFLYGVQVVLVWLRLDGAWLAVAWSHLVFVLPYVFLSLADPWRALDQRYPRTATALGASPLRTLGTIRLPMLLKPLLVAFAVGCAVSVGQYLPTLFAGGGRVATLTTEAITLSTGADRRILGVYTFLQAAIPLVVYALAIALPLVVYRRRRWFRSP